MGGRESERGEDQPRLSRRGFLRTAGGATTARATATTGGATAARATATAGTATTAAGTATAQEGETHTVDMTDGLVFDPDELTIAVGDTVVWENVGSVPHTVTAYGGDIPGEAAYFASGDFESEQAAREAYPPGGSIPGGESYQHTFEVEGEYDYFCIPHEQAGMVAQLTVGEAGNGGTATPGGDGGPAGPLVPDSARALVVATTLGFASVLLFAYFFVKYGGTYVEAE